MQAPHFSDLLGRGWSRFPGRHRRLSSHPQWHLIKLICVAEANIDGKYLTDGEYNILYGIAPNTQYALQQVDEVIRETREVLKANIHKGKDSTAN